MGKLGCLPPGLSMLHCPADLDVTNSSAYSQEFQAGLARALTRETLCKVTPVGALLGLQPLARSTASNGCCRWLLPF